MAQSETSNELADKLVVVWTSDDPYVAERVALMYTHAAKTNGWFNRLFEKWCKGVDVLLMT